MKLKDILKKVGSAVIKTVVPGGGMLIDTVNSFLPEDKKLPKDATGEQAMAAAKTLTPEQQSSLFEKELDVEIEEIRAHADIQESLAKADASGSSTRPAIADRMAWLVVCVIGVVVLAWAWAMLDNNKETLEQVKESWPFLLTLIGTPTALLRSYFGMRTKEKQSRYALAGNQQVNPANGILSMFSKK